MSARLVIHAEIETADELFEVIGLFLKKAAENPFELQRVGQYFVGVVHGLTKEQIEKPVPLEGEQA